MKRLLRHSLSLGLVVWSATAAIAQAIPGQSVGNAEVWIEAHPTLRPAPTETLVVHRAETPARRFTFRATVFPVAGISPGEQLQNGIIRTEKITLVDTVDGVTRDRLEESLRAIYDATIYNDYRRAEVLQRYPSNEVFLGNANTVRVGELKVGDRFAYWVELVATPEGFASSGSMTVFLKADLPELQEQLASR